MVFSQRVSKGLFGEFSEGPGGYLGGFSRGVISGAVCLGKIFHGGYCAGEMSGVLLTHTHRERKRERQLLTGNTISSAN